jgi:hypothetical protein
VGRNREMAIAGWESGDTRRVRARGADSNLWRGTERE